jgi:microcystin-dependent protein
MPDTYTPNYGLTKPEVGASSDTWGTKTNADWDIVDTKIKEAMDNAAAALAAAKAAIPAGAIIMGGTGITPSGYLPCNGAAVSRTTYSALFTAIGVAFGSGDNVNTFNVPDFRGYFPRGADAGRGIDPSRAMGSNQAADTKKHTHVMNAVAAHTHTIPSGGTHGHTMSSDGSHSHTGAVTDTEPAHSHTFTDLVWATAPAVVAYGASWAHQANAGTTSAAGSHSHTVSIPNNGSSAHTHTISGDGAHTHTINSAGGFTPVAQNYPTDASGLGAETRPINLAVNFYIKT